ncbi:MAG TPA: NAD(P)/FAD-dependent oxidoreductase [Chthoniobacterales bacterium]|nr:NAD(P)/FAD-dependent oxidoreductase [Chthoniobacterales bacterium]
MQIAIIGGGAAGFFAATACARANPANEVSIFERGSEFLTKVRISGGGRCNVTHACFDPRTLSEQYPRGERALIAPLHRFSPSDTVAWFEAHGVRLKTEPDGRMFPVTDSSRTIIDCLLNEAKAAGVRLFARSGIESAIRVGSGGFQLIMGRHGGHPLNGGTGAVPSHTFCDRLLLATGGSRSTTGAQIAQSLGHTILPPVPSLFSLHVSTPWLRSLPGVSIPDLEATVAGTKLRERGPMLITHNGVSGPAVLRLSAWGARVLHGLDYRFILRVNWLPDLTPDAVRAELQSFRRSNPNRLVINSPLPPLPARLWEQLALAAGIDRETRWTTLPRAKAHELARVLTRTELEVNGKSLNKDEFVTCGGVSLREINFKTMESRITPGLYFAGELLDLDGVTGGFNFQAAWTTGWIAGHAMADMEPKFLG